jgi:hypothetical protein
MFYDQQRVIPEECGCRMFREDVDFIILHFDAKTAMKTSHLLMAMAVRDLETPNKR